MSDWFYTAEARELADRPLAGHKGRVVYGAKYNCECGWASSTYYGKGAQGQAAYEFHHHKRTCLDEARTGAPDYPVFIPQDGNEP